ncbi:MAG: hypothetical protein JWM28_1733 [Chitinophagaceae bacterium]|nr:hypothetical protein [Chitinophagaceae bacterium]
MFFRKYKGYPLTELCTWQDGEVLNRHGTCPPVQTRPDRPGLTVIPAFGATTFLVFLKNCLFN